MGRMSDLDLTLATLGLDEAQRMATPLEAFPTDTATFAMHLRRVVRLYVTGLQAAGIPEPLGARLTVAAVVADLFALVGESEPSAVAHYIG